MANRPYQPKDRFFKQAKAEGLRARSAFKIDEIARRFRFFQKGQTVLDLVAADGGFLQILLEEVGPKGRVVGVDLAAIRPLNRPNVKTAVADVRDPGFDALLTSLHDGLPFRRKPAEELIRIEQEIVAEGLAPPNPWLADVADPEAQQPAAAPEREGAPKSATGSFIIDNVGPASLLDLINQSFEVMQTSLAQYKIAGYPPDVLINVPKRVCRFFEFYKAPELIALGREIARDTLDNYEGEKR